MEAVFKNGLGEVVDGARAISALFTYGEKNIPKFLGTTFFITVDGLMITAKHCVVDNNGKQLDSLFIYQILGDNKYLLRPIGNVYCNENSDIAVLVPSAVKNNITGGILRNPVPTLSSIKPKVDDVISSFAFPKTFVLNDGVNREVHVNSTWHFGKIEDYHENGISILKNSCYQSSMHILHGSSGGPVLNAKGKLIAINSSGSDVSFGLEPYSFLTPIEHCFNIVITGGDGNFTTINELIDKGIVLCEK